MIAVKRMFAVGIAIAVATSPAMADPGKSKKAKGKYEAQHEVGDCKYKIKGNQKGYSETVKCRPGAHFVGGPPPWAPAHGYRAKRKTAHLTREPYVPPFDLSLGRCNREVLGAVLGGGTGAAIGSQIGKGDGQTIAVVGGTILGILVGGSIGRMMDELDQNCVGQALEHAPDGQAIVWNDPQSNAQYQVAPVQTVQVADGQYCREYTATATVGGQAQETYGLACRQPDGAWKIVQ